MVNLDWLQTFCTLVETGHFTRTAEKLAMTQPGVSQQIRKLEQHFGQPLLLREGKSFSLTEAGDRVYHQAQRTLSQLDRLERSLQADSEVEGRCRLASPGSLGLRLYPGLLDLQVRHPGLQVEFAFAPNDSIEKQLAARQLDLGLITRPARLPELSSQSFADEPLYLVTPASVTQPDWATLEQLGYIDHPDGAHHAGLLLSANFSQFEQIDQLPRRGFSNQIGLILEPVARGLGFTVLPAYAVAAFAQPERILAHALDNPVSETVYLVKRRYQALPKRFSLITDTMAALLQAVN
ncbi:LysR family transcriptional regulator [Ferrimonas balearica]|uniref:LysR family transcriptional regulator n=1 Tax=Ferrimonas balearica TaxID=44012 RepID=UPI001F31D754|nr:LysR family transcriptional regulator [Ferrimonas balearica]MBY6016331.1 LysR family transcriptional regulator [Halomonas denitrificans]MBY6095399.1 LysR family transcriptional regulator [Ferrimonas balearica]